MEQIAKDNIKNALYVAALSARGQVMIGEATKEEAMRYIAEVGNAEFEKVFAMSETEVCVSMLKEIISE